MNIRIDDDVPLPEPDKPDTWATTAYRCATCNQPILPNELTGTECGCVRAVRETIGADMPGEQTWIAREQGGLVSNWVTGEQIKANPEWNPGPRLEYCPQCGNGAKQVGEACANCGSRYPSQTMFDGKGVPTVDCYLVGGPLNGRHGPIVGSAKVVELNMYAADGSVSSIELYELGDRGDLGARYWKGTKPA